VIIDILVTVTQRKRQQLLKVTRSHMRYCTANISETVRDKDVILMDT